MRFALSYEETQIVDFLKGSPKSSFSAVEIAKKAAGRRAYEENPRWAAALLPKLRARDVLDMDADGKYRFVTEQEREAREKKARKRMDMGR